MQAGRESGRNQYLLLNNTFGLLRSFIRSRSEGGEFGIASRSILTSRTSAAAVADYLLCLRWNLRRAPISRLEMFFGFSATG
jgi:hypothetical protein